jgi:hypothetical protein
LRIIDRPVATLDRHDDHRGARACDFSSRYLEDESSAVSMPRSLSMPTVQRLTEESLDATEPWSFTLKQSPRLGGVSMPHSSSTARDFGVTDILGTMATVSMPRSSSTACDPPRPSRVASPDSVSMRAIIEHGLRRAGPSRAATSLDAGDHRAWLATFPLLRLDATIIEHGLRLRNLRRVSSLAGRSRRHNHRAHLDVTIIEHSL